MPQTPESIRLDGMVDQMRELRGEGLSYRNIGKQLGCSADAVRYRLGFDGQRTPSPGKAPGTTDATLAETAEMWQLWTRGVSQREIAKRYGLSSASTVSERLKRFREHLPEDDREMVLRRELALLDELRRVSIGIFYNTALDPSTRLQAADRVLKGMERLSKMMGLDATDVRDEARLEMEQEQSALLNLLLRRILTALGLDPQSEEVREVVHRELALVANE